jgi:hypothetical protein
MTDLAVIAARCLGKSAGHVFRAAVRFRFAADAGGLCGGGATQGPMLVVIRKETGAYMTEAALILVQRMLAAGKGRGLYIALPTMATADVMSARIAPLPRRLYVGAPRFGAGPRTGGAARGLPGAVRCPCADP